MPRRAFLNSPRRCCGLDSQGGPGYKLHSELVLAAKPIADTPSWDEPYLTLHVVWHPRCLESEGAARHLIEHFTRARYSIEEMGVSVFEWSTPPEGSSVPTPIAMDTGEAAVIVALIADEIQHDSAWVEYIRELDKRCHPDDATGAQRRLIPVAMTPQSIAIELGVQALRWHDWEMDQNGRARRLVREVTYETGRMLRTMLESDPDLAGQMEKVRVFLSHSKHDNAGERIARRIRDWLHDDVQLSVFLDVADIPAGLPPDRVLETEVRRSAVLIVYTDSFSSREWCGREVLVAKERDRPIIVADCIEDLDERAFPYLANVPVVRLCSQQPHGVERVVGRLIDEIFKDFLWRCRTASLDQDNPCVKFVARAPELLTAVNIKKLCPNTSEVVYPDPPLSIRELNLIDGFGFEFLSLSQWRRYHDE